MTEPLRFGPYVAQGLVSSGAVTVTYRATQPELGRTVLLRTLKPGVSPASPFCREIEREATILARLSSHENVAALFDFVKSEAAHYLVLEDPGGHGLGEVMSRAGRLPWEAALSIALGLARGLAHAHARGIVHGDVRPEVALLTPGGGVKIMDFSRARGAGAEPEAAEIETLGEPAYLSPERLLGEPGDARSDVFAVGVLLFEMLSAARPFEGEARGDGEEGRARVRPAAIPSLRGIEPRPSAASRLVLRALSRAPGDRFAHAGTLADAIEEALAEEGALPPRLHVLRALSKARLGVEPKAPLAASKPPRLASLGPSVAAPARTLALLSAAMVLGGGAIEIGLHDREAKGGVALASQGGEAGPLGALRLLARPWAEVYLDGERVDVTPIGRPIPVTPGRHDLVFKHPAAPDEERTIRVAEGQSVLVDVTMRIQRPAPDAGPPEDPDSP